MINVLPAALLIGTIASLLLLLRDHALVGGKTKAREIVENLSNPVFHLPLVVGVLNAHVKNAARRMGCPLAHKGGQQVAQMHVPGRAGGKTADPGPLL